MKIIGQGHALGSNTVNNADVALKLGLNEDWFENATGIVSRTVCSDEEDVVKLSLRAIENALASAGVDVKAKEDRTLLLHIQNGFTHFTPPPAILLASQLGCKNLRSLSIDGVCSEPINMIEIANLMMSSGDYDYIIVSAGANFLPVVNDKDTGTVGLFGAGAGAILFGRSATGESTIKSSYWESKPEYWDLGIVELNSLQKCENSVHAEMGYYIMKGRNLAKVALKVIPEVLAKALSKAEWTLDSVDHFITHQPNAKLLAIGIKQLKVPKEKFFCPVATVGNLGPASLLSSFSMAKEQQRLKSGDKVVFISFGLGFSCGAICLEYSI